MLANRLLVRSWLLKWLLAQAWSPSTMGISLAVHVPSHAGESPQRGVPGARVHLFLELLHANRASRQSAGVPIFDVTSQMAALHIPLILRSALYLCALLAASAGRVFPTCAHCCKPSVNSFLTSTPRA